MEGSAGRWRMEEAQKGVTEKILKLNLQNDRVAGLLELQNGRACSFQKLQELELQMSGILGKKNAE